MPDKGPVGIVGGPLFFRAGFFAAFLLALVLGAGGGPGSAASGAVRSITWTPDSDELDFGK